MNDSQRWLTAEQATESLGVSRPTLYAYVSRRLVGTAAAPDDPRRSLYDAADIARLLARKRRGRSRQAVAESTLSWGEPVLASGITQVSKGRLFYRGKDAASLAARASLEEVAALLWGVTAPPPWPMQVAAGPDVARSCIAAVASIVTTGTWTDRPDSVRAAAGTILRSVAAAACGGALRGRPIHTAMGDAWGLDKVGADRVRRALVLCADHELNPSTYAARVVAGTRAPLGACVLAGLAALIGPLHGGVTAEVTTLMTDPLCRNDPAQAIALRLARGQRLAGFGHPLYPDGDPRAADLLAALPEATSFHAVAAEMLRAKGVHPNVDFALAALEAQLALPAGAAFAVFATGRVVGWIAHALEQWRDGGLIRPRAVYTGP